VIGLWVGLGCTEPTPSDAGAVTTIASPWIESPRAAEDRDPDPAHLHASLVAVREDGVYAYLDAARDGLAAGPGPTLRARVGDTLTVDLLNAMDVPTTIHWHGLRVPNAMDGAGWMDAPLSPGERFTYTFPLTQPGTFWYHPHVDTERQVDGGLYGFLVVDDPAEPPAERDLLLVFDTPREADADAAPMDHARARRAAPDTADTDAHGGGEHAGGGASGLRWTVNGRPDARVSVRAGERVRARILNASNLSYLDLRGPPMRLLADDQGLLGAAQVTERLLLAPGDRAEVEWTPGAGGSFALLAAPYTLAGGEALGEPVPALVVDVTGDAASGEALALPFQGTGPTPDPGRTDVRYVLSGDPHTNDWRINREAWPDVTPTEVQTGREVVIEVRNLSPTRHPFHVHGHAFEVLSSDGVPPPTRTVVDTWDVGIRETARFLLRADNPGEWMVHCHVLGHEAHGMMTLLRVAP
jgi:FtsP/CotA-like multicopper oxidase with cupredoxin domain